jgi:hypothetical protein
MSHIYQPVMLKRIFLNDGSASINEIAKDLLSYDQSQIEYYEDRTKNMVGKVLTKIEALLQKDGDKYLIDGFNQLSEIKKNRNWSRSAMPNRRVLSQTETNPL